MTWTSEPKNEDEMRWGKEGMDSPLEPVEESSPDLSPVTLNVDF